MNLTAGKSIKIKLRLSVSILLILVSIQPTFAQSSNGTSARMTSARLMARNLKTTALWYRRHLNFQIKDVKMNESAKLRISGFEIQLIQPKRTVLSSNLRLPKGKTFINGFFKIGFRTAHLDSLHAYLDHRNASVDSLIVYDDSLKTRTFLVRDPDGNRLQFFEDKSLSAQSFPGISPYFFALITSDYKNTLSWYRDRLGFREIFNLDTPIKNIYIRLLKRGDVLLEVIHSPNRSVETTELLSYDVELAGFQRVGIGFYKNGSGKEEVDNDGNKLIIKR